MIADRKLLIDHTVLYVKVCVDAITECGLGI